MPRTTAAFILLLVSAAAPVSLRAQVPDVTGTCVSNCGGSSGGSTARDRQLARNHAQHAKEEKWFNEVKRRWEDAAKRGNGFSKDGQKALAKGGQCAAAVQDFQRELAAFSVDLTPAGRIVDAILGGKYNLMLVAQQQAIKNAQNRLTAASASCFAPVAAVPVAPAAPATAAPAVRNAVPGRPAAQAPAANRSSVVLASKAPLRRIGAAGAIRGNPYMLLDDGTRVPIHPGSAIYFNTRIVTGEGGHMQITLLDDSLFTLGPDSNMVLDEFVYDPNTSIGKLTANFAKGTFRFVTGKMRHTQPDNARVKLPVGDLGIRGTDFEVKYEPGAAGYIALATGGLQITPTNGLPFSMEAGDKAVITADGTVLSPDEAARAAKPAATAARYDAAHAESWQPACDGGDGRACLSLALCYRVGCKGVGQDAGKVLAVYRLGVALLNSACERGSANACESLGEAYVSKMVGPPQLEKAADLYQRACDADNAAGCLNLGQMYQGAQGVVRDIAKAMDLFQRACDGGAARACRVLGAKYAKGIDVGKDEQQASTFYSRAIAAYQRACDGDSAVDCNALGTMYQSGEGVAQDTAKALGLFQRACDGGSADACRVLGSKYEEGGDVAKDQTKALAFYVRACSGGDAWACAREKALEKNKTR